MSQHNFWPEFNGIDPVLAKAFTFLLEAGKLKSVLRQTQLLFPDRRENSAEHSWHLILMALVLRDYAAAPVDLNRVLCMLAVHDLGEMEKGDVFHYDKIPAANTERASVHKLFALLDDATAAKLMSWWDEFEAAITPESQFARALDRLQPFLDNLANGGESWHRNKVPLEKALAKNADIAIGAPVLWDAHRTLAIQAAAAGLFYKDAA